MESKIRNLFEAIEDKQEMLYRRVELFGKDHFMTTNAYHELVGMKQAFEIIAGMSYVEYLINVIG